MRNIVLCCDGTSNEFSRSNTNVVKLFSMLVREPATQLCFYDPGVGTFSSPAALTSSASVSAAGPGLNSSGSNLDKAFAAMMRRVYRMASTATRRSSGSQR